MFSEREFLIEWISLVENYSCEEKLLLIKLTNSEIEKKYMLALIKATDEFYNSN